MVGRETFGSDSTRLSLVLRMLKTKYGLLGISQLTAVTALKVQVKLLTRQLQSQLSHLTLPSLVAHGNKRSDGALLAAELVK